MKGKRGAGGAGGGGGSDGASRRNDASGGGKSTDEWENDDDLDLRFDLRNVQIHEFLKDIRASAKKAKQIWKRKLRKGKMKSKAMYMGAKEERKNYRDIFMKEISYLLRAVDDLKQMIQLDTDDVQDPADSSHNRGHVNKNRNESDIVLDNLIKQNEELQKSLKAAEEKKRKLADEKEDLMTRLSQVAGSKLRDNNPAITDLSDPNRPMKIAEKVSELYDNEWTDAMELLEKSMPELDALKTLLNIFTGSFEECVQISNENIDRLRCDLTIAGKQMQMAAFPIQILKQMKDLRKSAAEMTVHQGSMKQQVTGVLQKRFGVTIIQQCQSYVDRCIEYCWYMCIQDPPLHMEYDYRKGMPFTMDLMRAYTQSGPIVDYVVWPALYLQKNGALLAKAVVQATNITSHTEDHMAQKKIKTFPHEQDFRCPVYEKSLDHDTGRGDSADRYNYTYGNPKQKHDYQGFQKRTDRYHQNNPKYPHSSDGYGNDYPMVSQGNQTARMVSQSGHRSSPRHYYPNSYNQKNMTVHGFEHRGRGQDLGQNTFTLNPHVQHPQVQGSKLSEEEKRNANNRHSYYQATQHGHSYQAMPGWQRERGDPSTEVNSTRI